MRALLAVALVAAPVSASVSNPIEAFPSPYKASFIVVPRMDCGEWRGSGVRLSGDLIISATHVTKGRACTAYGKPTTYLSQEPGLDVSFSSGSLDPGFRAIVSCAGIREGEKYIAMGYPEGDAPAVQELIGTDIVGSLGQVGMRGSVYHGMSGGGVFDVDGRLVAIINRITNDYTISFVTPLSETYLCRKVA